MNILIIGSGGREHALAWKIAQSQHAEKVFVAPGNAGTALERGVENVSIPTSDMEGLIAFAGEKGIGLTVVGPEAPLVAGITDAFNAAGLPCFGPSQKAAQLEGSKAFAKDFLIRHRIPTASYETFTDLEKSKAFIRRQGSPIVVKADGLAAGKGVIVAAHEDEAIGAAENMLSRNAFGNAGSRIIIEECLQGEEVSFIVMVDGKSILPLATSQDHKARDVGDIGPNTGGMGAYSPAPVVTSSMYNRIMKEVIEPTVEGMASEGMPYTGFLYAGLMISKDGTPKVLEYNCRFGDPETQPILLRFKSDFLELCLAALRQGLNEIEVAWDPRAALGVVMAAGGYPLSYRKEDVIYGLPMEGGDDLKVFHAGTTLKDGQIVTSGGRVLCVTALGATVGDAQRNAYGLVEKIHWKDVYYRTDIGYRAILRESATG